MSTIRKITSCNCNKSHRKYKAFVRCFIPNAGIVSGDGPFALIAWCNSPSRRVPRQPSASLWKDPESALHAMANMGGCGGGCVGKHEIVELVK